MSERLTETERRELGAALEPLLEDASSGPTEWHQCEHCPHSGGRCPCSGVPYLGAEMTDTIERIITRRLRDHDRHTRATTLRDAAEAWATGEWADTFTDGGVKDDESAARATETWLLQRADKEEGATP